ncbi:family 2 glycosyl transferase [Stappia sp. 22II-S9-Z10]|nr:family 2 glycosyl transferase [Stappia sp. 22II-S9-Z10]
MRVSVLLLTFNEAANLPTVLAQLISFDDIVAVDSGSTDDTLDLLARHGVRVLNRPFDDFARQRNFGLDEGALRHEWVLHLDADEVLTPDFITALEALAPSEELDAYYVPSKTIFFGRWLKHAGMYPSYQARLGHRDRLRFVQVGHGQREDLPTERVGVFPEPYLHYSFSHGLVPWLDKHVRYAAAEAIEIAHTKERERKDAGGRTAGRRRLKRLANLLPLPLRPVMRFVYVYLWRRGFLDGRAGLRYAVMLAVYEGMIAVAAFERIGRGKTPGGSLRPQPPLQASSRAVLPPTQRR